VEQGVVSAPVWLPNHTYALWAIVRPTATDLPMYRCTTAGVSGAAEPTWPVANPWMTSDGSVVWTLNTTFRQQIHAGLLTTLGLFKTANPTLLRKIWHVRPESFTLGDLPAVVLGSMSEEAITQQGIRTRGGTLVTFEIIDRAPDPDEADERMNVLVDAFWDLLTANPHMASGTSLVTPIGVIDNDSGSITEAPNLNWISNTFAFSVQTAEGRI
jgi:hypothetical protein